MSVNFKYTTPPALTSNSLGYLAVNQYFILVSLPSDAVYVNLVTFTLPAGTYIYSLCGSTSVVGPATVTVMFNDDIPSSLAATTEEANTLNFPIAQNLVIQPTSSTTYVLKAQSNGITPYASLITGRVNVVRIA